MGTRTLLLCLGHLCVALGTVGIFLPLLPTTPFVLVAAFCYSKSSPRFHRWLHAHPRLGPVMRAWQQHGVIPRRAKGLACLSLACSLGFLLVSGRLPALGQGLVVTGGLAVAAFILSRPSSPPAA